MSTINTDYYPYYQSIAGGTIETAARFKDLPLFKLNEEVDTSIFYCQNNTNPNMIFPSSCYIKYVDNGTDVKSIVYDNNSSYNTLKSGDAVNNPTLRSLFPENLKIRLALAKNGMDINCNAKIGNTATTVPSDLTYVYPYIKNSYKKLIFNVFLYCEQIPYGALNSTFTGKTPAEYLQTINERVTAGIYPDIETAKKYFPILGLSGYFSYFDVTTNTWIKISAYEGFIYDLKNSKKDLYYMHNMITGYQSSGSLGLMTHGRVSNKVSRTVSEGVDYSTGLKYNTLDNSTTVRYWWGNIPSFVHTDWKENRLTIYENDSNLHNKDDLRYWQVYDYMSGGVKYSHTMLCWTLEGILRYVASLGLFFTTDSLSNLTTDLSDLDNLPDYIHMPEITANGFTTGNYFTGREIGKSDSVNKDWDDTSDSTIKVDDASGTGDNVENLELAIGNTYVNSFVRMYSMTRNQVVQLAKEFSNPTNTIPVGKNPFDNIIGLQQFPIDLSTQALGNSENIVIDTWDTNVSAIKVNGCIPSRLIGRYTIDRQYNNFLDFEPYTTVELYIPMCGRIQLPLNYLMGKTFEVHFIQDIENGACKAIVKCDQISAEIVGDLSESVVITAQNQGIKKQSIMDSAISAAGGIASAAVSGVSNNIGGAAAGAATYMSGIAGTIAAFNANYSIIKGASTAKCNFINVPTCYIKITRPTVELPTNYGHTVGYVANITKKLSDVHGYTICNNPDVQCNLTAAEKQKLKNYLQSGVYLP